MKTCTKCKEVKPFEAFHKDRTHSDGLRSFCKACVGKYTRTYYETNRDLVMTKTYAWIEKNRDRHNQKCNRWAKLNKGSVNARTARRYASKTQATPKWLTVDDHWMIKEAYALAKIREKMLGGHWEVDHIYPLRGKLVSGLHVPTNLRVIQRHENRRKSNTVPL